MSSVFSTQIIQLGFQIEEMVLGGPDQFHLLGNAFAGIQQIAVIGFGSQGFAQAQNLRDSLLRSTDVNIKVGLRPGGASWQKAIQAGFTEANGTLGEVYQTVSESDLVLWLIPDAEQVQEYPKMFKALKPHATLGLSHGFLLGHLRNLGQFFPPNINVVAVCPKGMGFLVREYYLEGKGFPATVAIEQDVTGKAKELAVAWGVALGCPRLFFTTLKNEYVSNMFGERGIILGALHGISQVFQEAASAITGPISQVIAKKGIKGLYESFSQSGQKDFLVFFEIAYSPFRKMMGKLYEDVESGREIAQVVEAGKIKSVFSKNQGTKIYSMSDKNVSLPLIAAIYVAGMISQIDVLLEKGHKVSEICLESVVDAVTMLNPHMHKVGIDYTLENCSLTAGVGARLMSPRFSKMIQEQIFPQIKSGTQALQPEKFLNHPIHKMLQDFYNHV